MRVTVLSVVINFCILESYIPFFRNTGVVWLFKASSRHFLAYVNIAFCIV